MAEKPPNDSGSSTNRADLGPDQSPAGSGLDENLEEIFDAIGATEGFKEFSRWCLENWLDMRQTKVNTLVTTLTGALIGHFLTSGASPDMVKQYFARFVDMTAPLIDCEPQP